MHLSFSVCIVPRGNSLKHLIPEEACSPALGMKLNSHVPHIPPLTHLAHLSYTYLHKPFMLEFFTAVTPLGDCSSHTISISDTTSLPATWLPPRVKIQLWARAPPSHVSHAPTHAHKIKDAKDVGSLDTGYAPADNVVQGGL